MPSLQLNAIATQILLDESFQQALLESHSQNCLAEYSLTDQERIAVLTLTTRSPDQFIHELYGLMCRTGTLWLDKPIFSTATAPETTKAAVRRRRLDHAAVE